MKKKLAAAISVVLILSVLAAVPFNSTAAGGKEFVYPNTYDFSEMNMASNCSSAAPDGFDYTEGGNTQMSTAYLASWDGAVSEFADPYSDSYDYKEIESSFHIRDVVYLDRTNIKEIKAAVMEYGAVSVAFLFSANHLKWDGEGSRAAYYFPAGISVDAMAENDVAGHGVTIIGWDDNFSVENFNDKPLGNGAFLCKNSWDSSFGEEGFFYLSYYDNCFSGISLYGIADIAGMTPGTAVYTAPEINVEYNKIYQYDPLGSVSQFSSAINRIDYVANVFPEKGSTLAADETLHAVSFYTHDTNMKYDICIVDGYVSKSELARRIAGNDFACVQSGTAAEMGYHTFDLEQPVQLKAGTRFAVVVRLKTNLGRRAGFGCEYPMNNFASSKVRAGYEESLYYCNGICYDLTNELENANWCLKAFTKASVCASDGNSAGVLNGVNASRRPMSDKTYSPLQAVALGAKISESFLAYASNKGRGIAGVVPDSNIFYGSDEVLSLGKSLPESYDLRDYGRVSPVRNQGNLGSCWAHAAYASLESCMLKEYGAQGVDFFNGAAVSIGQNANEQTVELAAGGEYIISYKPIQKENIMYAKIQSDKKLECEIISEYGVVMHMLAGKSIEITEDMMVVGERRYLRIRFADPGAAGSFKFVPQMLRDVYYPFETAAKIVRGGAASPADPAAEEAVFSFDMSPNGGEAHFCFTSLTKSDCFVRVCDKDGITIPDYYYDQAFTSCGARSLTVYPRETGENETLYIYVRGGGSFTLNYAVGEAERDAIVLTERMKAAKAYAGSAGIIVENGEPLMFSFVPGRDGSYIPLISGYDTGFFDAGFGVYDSTGAKHTDFYVDALGNTTTFAKLRAGNKYFISIDGSDFENQEVTMLEYSAVPPKTDITIDEDGYAGYSFFTMGQTVCTSFSPPESGKYEVSVWEKVGMVIKDGDGGVVLDGAVDECCEVSLEKGKTYAIEIKNIEGYCSSFAYILIRLVVEPVNIELKPGEEADIGNDGSQKIITFSPERDGNFFFSVDYDDDDSAHLFFYDGNNEYHGCLQLVSGGEASDSGELNAVFSCNLKAGEKYTADVNGNTLRFISPDTAESQKSYDLIYDETFIGEYGNNSRITLCFTPDSEYIAMQYCGSSAPDVSFFDIKLGMATSKLLFGKNLWTRIGDNTYEWDITGLVGKIFEAGKTYKIKLNNLGDGEAFSIKTERRDYGKVFNPLNKNVRLVKGVKKDLLKDIDDDKKEGITFASNDESVVTVDENGIARAVGFGTARVFVFDADGAPSGSCTVVVYRWWEWLFSWVIIPSLWSLYQQ